jgi:hypothetical protein
MGGLKFEEIATSGGWGNISSKLWFVGIEPGGDWADEWKPNDEKFSVRGADGKVVRTTTWQIAAKIVAGLNGGDFSWSKTWPKYRDELAGHVYWINALPLPRPQYMKMTDKFKKVIEPFGIKDNDTYINEITH